MEAIECIKTRMSIRKFRPEPVPHDVLTGMLKTSLNAPSYKNSQPWEVAIVSGRKKEELSDMLVDLIEKGARPNPDIPAPVSWPVELNNRMDEHVKRRAAELGMDLSDPECSKKTKVSNARFYGAPHVIFLHQDSSLSAWSLIDIGMFAQSLLLAAHAKGLGTVPQAYLADYSGEVKRFIEIPETRRLILGISIGYPDLKDKANSYKSLRVSFDRIAKWIE